MGTETGFDVNEREVEPVDLLDYTFGSIQICYNSCPEKTLDERCILSYSISLVDENRYRIYLERRKEEKEGVMSTCFVLPLLHPNPGLLGPCTQRT